MSGNEGTGNTSGTSAYFSNGSAEGDGANFFDHNPAPTNQWGFYPGEQQSSQGGFPQHQQQPQQVPQFYNPLDFQKSAQSQQPEIFNPYPNLQQQDSFQQQQQQQQQPQQQYGYNQQYNQNHDMEHQQAQQHPQQNMEVNTPYQQTWPGYGAPFDGGYGYPAEPGNNEQGTAWQNQHNVDGHPNWEGQAAQQVMQPEFDNGVATSGDFAGVNQQDIQSGPPPQSSRIVDQDQEDASSCSGFGAFYHDDESDIVESSGKESVSQSENASERTSPDTNIPNPAFQGYDQRPMDNSVSPGTHSATISSPPISSSEFVQPGGGGSTNHGLVQDVNLNGRTDDPFTFHQGNQNVPSFPGDVINPSQFQGVDSGAAAAEISKDLGPDPEYRNTPDNVKGIQDLAPPADSLNGSSVEGNVEVKSAIETSKTDRENSDSASSEQLVHQLLSVPFSGPQPVSSHLGSQVSPSQPNLVLSPQSQTPVSDLNNELPQRTDEQLSATSIPTPVSETHDQEFSGQKTETALGAPPLSSPPHPAHDNVQTPHHPEESSGTTPSTRSDEQQLHMPQNQAEAMSSGPSSVIPQGQSIVTAPPPVQLPDISGEKAQAEESKSRSDSVSSGSHVSAFRQVRGHHSHRDMSVNPSPPLWKAEVPPLPGNILLAPAALNISSNFTPMVPSASLSTPSISSSTPGQLAASVASVSVPPLPAVVAPLLTGGSDPTSKASPTTSSHLTNPVTPANPAVSQLSQNVSQLNISQTVPHTTAPNHPPEGTLQGAAQQPSQAAVPNLAGNPHPVIAPQSQQVTSQVATQPGQPQPYQAPVTSGAHYHNQNVAIPSTSQGSLQASTGVQPQQQVAGATSVQQQPPVQPTSNQATTAQNTAVVSTSGAVPSQQSQQQPQQHQQPHQQPQQSQQPPQQQLQQQPHQPYQQQQGVGPGQGGPEGPHQGYGSYPSEGGHWYPHERSQYPPGYYQGSPYGHGYRGYGYGYPASPYGRQHPYSRQDPYYQGPSHGQQQGYGRPPQQQRTPHRAGTQQWDQTQSQSRPQSRPQSRQGMERPSSRQGWGYDYDSDSRYPRSRRDPRHYGGVDEYGRPYDRRYYDYYYGKKYAGYYWDNREKYYEYAKSRGVSQQYSQDQSTAAETSRQDEKDGGQSQSDFASEFHHQGGDTPERYGANQSGIYSGYDYYDQQGRRGYGYDHSGNSSGMAAYDGSYYDQDYSWQQQEEPVSVEPTPPARLTPVKHSLPHVIARFSPGGQLIKVLPNVPADGMPAIVEVHSVETMIQECVEIQDYKKYPGPLIKGETHKNDVLHFAAAQATECRKSTTMTDRESAALLWDLLVLLCRQNGTVVETDISDLLLTDHPMTTRVAVETDVSQGEEVEAETTDDVTDQSSLLLSHLSKPKEGPDPSKQTHRFRELLLFGRKKEALEWAMKGGLWGHALLLASKMDNRTHASVMTRFANSLPMNDPLQTLYQLMSDRQPAAVTSCSDEKWGDWRPHLAMVMSNLTSSADVGYKSVLTLGDSLASRGLLHASQFCYLMAQIGFGIYSKKTTKIVLLGSSHNLPFSKFATNPAIQLTEIYEYAQMLANKHFLIPNFQPYKFIYACRLADLGFTSQALRYCETIANTIQCSANYYNATLVSQLCELSHRLKHHDPEYHDLREITEPHWIKPLENILVQINEGQLKPPSSSGTPMPWVESSSNLSTMGGESTDGTVQAMSEGVMSFPYDGQGAFQQDQSQQDQGGAAKGYEQYYDQQQVQNQYQDPGQQDPSQQQQVPFYDIGQQQLQQDAQQHQQPPLQADGTHNSQGQQHQYPTSQYGAYQPYNPTSMSQNFAANQDLGASVGSNFSEYSTTTNTETDTDTTEFEQSGASQFDFHRVSHMQGRGRTNTMDSMGGPPSPQKTLTPPDSPDAMTRSRARTMSGGSTASTQSTTHLRQPKQPEPKETKSAASTAKPKSTSGGWFRWFNKKIGGSNIHLPDDTKKTIEWDPVKKKWVDTNATEEEDSGPPPPPPSDKEIEGSAPPGPPSSAGGAPPPGGITSSGVPQPAAGAPPTGPNKFSRKFGPGNYVDVLNKGKGQSSLSKAGGASSLFQTFPNPASSAPVNFFIPDTSMGDSNQSVNQDDQAPQVGNPGSRPHSPSNQQQGAENLSRSSSMSDLSCEVSQHMAHQASSQPPSTWEQQDASLGQNQPPQQPPPAQQQQQPQPPPPPAAQPAGVPMMYNPQQFAQPAGYGQGGGSGPTRRSYGAPRQYPNQR
ncbi:uncharacterized protein [Diadema antillarum]|uniref:uncharacterized protein n=1 Tax=Diadema antillarum TaxID=105358 RepID=UPI003A844F87